MYGYIYITTDLLTGKKYIGKHKASKFEFDTYKGSGIEFRSIPKSEYTTRLKTELLPETFGVPTICNSLEELNFSEKYYIDLYDCVNSDQYYNRSSGGDGGDIYSLLSSEQQKFRNAQISIHSKEWWQSVTPEEIESRTDKWRQTYFNKPEEEILLRNKRNSDSLKKYNAELSLERKLELHEALKAGAQKRISNKDVEERRKEKERFTKSNHTLEQKAEYTRKQRESHIGTHNYTDGTIIIRCKPENVPEGFIPCGGHKNNARYICEYNMITYQGLNDLCKQLELEGYLNIDTDKLLRAKKDKKYGYKKFPQIIDKIIIFDRKEGLYL